MKNILVVAFIWCALGWAVICRADVSSWPAVKPVRRVFNVPDVQKMNVSLLIRSTSGRPLYRLRCAHPGYAGEYSGDFECRLDTVESGDTQVEWTLLIEDARQIKAWPSRGRFFTADLIGVCARLPEFGAIRNFRLRGMRLTLQVIDPIIDSSKKGWGGPDDPKLKALKLKVTVQRDPSADRSIAAIVSFPKQPPPQCGITSKAWVVGALGTLGHSSTEVSYFGDPATFAGGEPPTPVDWKSVPFSTPGEWNHGMHVGATPSRCSAHFYGDVTFQGMLIPQKFILRDTRPRAESKSFTFDGAVLKLDHPANICPRVASNSAPVDTSAMIQGTPVTAMRFAEAHGPATHREGASMIHVTALEPDAFNLIQLGAYNQKFIGHRVEIWGRVGPNDRENPLLERYNLLSIIVDRICLLREGESTTCSSNKRPL